MLVKINMFPNVSRNFEGARLQFVQMNARGQPLLSGSLCVLFASVRCTVKLYYGSVFAVACSVCTFEYTWPLHIKYPVCSL